MNRDDVIRMAREAGMEVHERKGEVRIGSAVITGCDSTEAVERFARLVAAHEREAAANLAEQMRPTGGRAWSAEQFFCFQALSECAAAIRQRGSAD